MLCTHIIYSRTEAYTVFDIFFFLSRGTSKSRGHPHPPGKVQWTGVRAPAGGERVNHACPGAGAGGDGGHSAASAREEISRLISGCLADAKCVSGQQEEGRGSESSGRRRRSSRPTRSVSACALASANRRGWARDRGRATHTAGAPSWATDPPVPLQWSRGRPSSDCWEPSSPPPPPPPSCDPGQVRKVSWVGAAP